jgi:hypothetical protein
MTKPLFIPLRRQWFDAFADGSKTEEWRRYGARWNEGTCALGRAVTLSCGYSGARLSGRVSSFRTEPASGGAAELYGAGAVCAVVGISLEGAW